jgi:hypothetical protein
VGHRARLAFAVSDQKHPQTRYSINREIKHPSFCFASPQRAARRDFRRGPSNRVLLTKWNLDRDTFEHGQWLNARVYERRCDLSPDGDMLLYFSASRRKPYLSWSAISPPPYFSALALWPKGDAWGGGGQFGSRSRILLNHREGEMALAEGFSVPKWLKVSQLGDHSGWGEDEPVWPIRLQGDGWKLTCYPERTKDDFGARVKFEFDPPMTWYKAHPFRSKEYGLQMSILGMGEKNGSWYLFEHALVGKNGIIESIGRSDWADWSSEGDLLFAQSGCLYRLRYKKGALGPIETSEEIADFSNLVFENKEPSEGVCQWPSVKRKSAKTAPSRSTIFPRRG